MNPVSDSITFIGGGNMARSLIGGLIAAGKAPEKIRVAEPVEAVRQTLAADFSVQVFAENADAVAGSGIWLLAVKPQAMKALCQSLAAQAQAQKPLLVSVAAGITSEQISTWLGGGLAVVRTMPNTPALLGAGVTGLYANPYVSESQKQAAQALLQGAGATVWIADEALMDAVTAVSGSGPAYVFLLAEAMQAAGEAEGLDAEAARTLTIQTLLGAARMLTHDDTPAAELRRRVTSPGGTTQAAIESFEADDFRAIVARAIHAARQRGIELAKANH